VEVVMTKLVILAAAAVMPLLAAAAAAAPGDAACHHYDNRARFLSRTADIAFLTVLAEACVEAQEAVRGAATPSAERAAAKTFLATLDAARGAISAINAGRISQRHRDVALQRQGAGLRLVSNAGEYLILRQAGVFAALEDWVQSGGRFILASAMPGAARVTAASDPAQAR
jgi:hypothetical protein